MILNAFWAMFPVTLAFLVALLVAKETYDRLVRRAADKRRVVAIKAIVGEELSRNVVTASALGQALHRIEDGLDQSCDVHLSSRSDALEVTTTPKSGSNGTRTLVRPVRRDALDRLVTEAAGLDRDLFQLMLKWLRAAAALEGVRDDLLVRGERASQDQGGQHLRSFASSHSRPVADSPLHLPCGMALLRRGREPGNDAGARVPAARLTRGPRGRQA